MHQSTLIIATVLTLFSSLGIMFVELGIKYKNKILFFGLAALMFILGAAVVFYYWKKGSQSYSLPDLPKENLKLGKSKGALVFFYADWCGHCKTFKPVWDHVKKELDHKIEIYDIESKNCKPEYKITGFPTIRFYPEGLGVNKYSEYSGDRSFNSVILFAESKGQS